MSTIRVNDSFNCFFDGKIYTAVIDGKFYEALLLSRLVEIVTNLPFPPSLKDDLRFYKPDAEVVSHY